MVFLNKNSFNSISKYKVPWFLWVALFVTILVIIGEVIYYYKLQGGRKELQSVRHETSENIATTVFPSEFIFTERGEPIEVGIKEKGESEFLLMGFFESSVYEDEGMNVARIKLKDKSLLLVFNLERVPILTMFSESGEILPPKRDLTGKTRKEINEIIQKGTPFVAKIKMPYDGSSDWDKLIDTQKEYIKKNSAEMPSKKIGFVKTLVLLNEEK